MVSLQSLQTAQAVFSRPPLFHWRCGPQQASPPGAPGTKDRLAGHQTNVWSCHPHASAGIMGAPVLSWRPYGGWGEGSWPTLRVPGAAASEKPKRRMLQAGDASDRLAGHRSEALVGLVMPPARRRWARRRGTRGVGRDSLEDTSSDAVSHSVVFCDSGRKRGPYAAATEVLPELQGQGLRPPSWRAADKSGLLQPPAVLV
jgi:hypothetical protein